MQGIYSERLKSFMAFFLFLFISLILYEDSVIALPRGDHASVLKERLFYSSEWDFLINMLSYSRMHQGASGDAFLFRPGTTGLLGLLDIYLRHNLFAIGALSIIWHAFVAWSIFIFGRSIHQIRAGFFLAFLFLAQYAGMELVLWRHISPYMFSLIFFGMGLSFLNSSTYSLPWKVVVGSSFLFFLSMLFHEILSFALPLAGGIMLLMWRSLGDIRKYATICFAPSIIFHSINFLDYYLSNVSKFFGPADAINFGIIDLFLNTFRFVGYILIAYFVPWFVQLEGMRGRTSWDFSIYPDNVIMFIGFVAVLVYLISARTLLKNRRGGTLCFSMIIMICMLFVFVEGLVIGRISLRGMDYIKTSTYYFYFTSYLFSVIILLNINSIRQYLENKFGSLHLKRFSYAGYALVISSWTMSAYSLHETLPTSLNDQDRKQAALVHFISQYTDRDSGYCYGGEYPANVTGLDERLLYRHKCDMRPGDAPLYLMGSDKGAFQLSQVNGSFADFDEVRYNNPYFPLVWSEPRLDEMKHSPKYQAVVDLLGRWFIGGEQGCEIRYSGMGSHELIIVNEHNFRVLATFRDGAIHADNHLLGQISPDGRNINWSNGTSWSR